MFCKKGDLRNFAKFIGKNLCQGLYFNKVAEIEFCEISKSTSSVSDPMTSLKSYWSILKTFLNNKKTPFIPPLLHDDKLITNFKDKAEMFNNLFAKQCSFTNTNSDLPSVLSWNTHKSLSTIKFTIDDILKIIKKLDPNEAHGHDIISIRMIKICYASICKPLELIFRSCLEDRKFPTEWKKANVVPAHKNGDKQNLKN